MFRCGKEVFARKYTHDYAQIYGKEAKTRGPLNARLTGPYNYFDPEWHPYYHGTELHSMQSVSKTVSSVIIGIAMLLMVAAGVFGIPAAMSLSAGGFVDPTSESARAAASSSR